jgi:hypothetical protein
MPGKAHRADAGERVRDPLSSYGRTYAQEAGIRLADQPSTLYQLLVLTTLQDAWPSVAPYVDDRMTKGARRAGLPDGRDDLATLLTESGHPSRLAAALVQLSHTRNPPGNTAQES